MANDTRFKNEREALEAITSAFEHAVREADVNAPGGMRLAFVGDFTAAARLLPSLFTKIRWWARELRAVLEKREG